MKCRQCDSENISSARFCANCGTSLEVIANPHGHAGSVSGRSEFSEAFGRNVRDPGDFAAMTPQSSSSITGRLNLDLEGTRRRLYDRMDATID